MKLTSKIFKRNSPAIAACLVVTCAFAASAGPYDGYDTRPGMVITNEVSAVYGDAPTARAPIVDAASFVVGGFETPATLEAYVYAQGSSAATVFDLSPTEYSTSGTETGPFARSQPAEHAGATILGSGPTPITPAERILYGEAVFLILTNTGMNVDSRTRDTALLRLADEITGDVEVLRLTETGPDTGVFGGYINTSNQGDQVSDGSLSTTPLSRIDAQFDDPWRTDRELADFVMVGPVDPFGMFFDSQTGAPISGATITIINQETGNPAVVYGDDLTSIYPSTITSGDTVTDSSGATYDLDPGEYRFPYVDVGTYHFEVTPPTGYEAPSTRADDDLQSLPGAPFEIKDGSRLEAFAVTAGPAIEIDIPLDSSAILDVQRSGSVDEADLGDIVSFSVSIGSSFDDDSLADLVDFLPAGLAYVAGTARIDGILVEDPVISSDGRSLTFEGISIPHDQRAEITYLARIDAAAREGSVLTSSSRAQSESHLSNTATHDLKVLHTFSMNGDIVSGQVYPNGCEAQHDPDLDLSNIRIYTQSGRYVKTDKNGRFTFRNLSRGTHALSLDEISLPNGYTPILCENNTRKAGSATSVFVQARGGFMRQVAFHLQPVEGGSRSAATPAIKHQLATDFGSQWFQKRNPQPGIVFPPANYLPSTPSLDVVMVRDAGQFIELYLDGEPIPSVHKRTPIAHERSSLSLDTWRGVALTPGRHSVRGVVKNYAGEVIKEDVRIIQVAGDPRKIEVVEDRSSLQSDGRSNPVVALRILDADGIPTMPGGQATVSIAPPFSFAKDNQAGNAITSAGQDLQRATVQVDAEGFATFMLSPTRAPGVAQLSFQTKDIELKTEVHIASVDRPWVVIGLAEGSAAHKAISDNIITPGSTELAEMGSIVVSGRAALFAEGVIDGKWLATVRYDSAIDDEIRDFFDIDVNDKYIVYADASTEHDAAQSRHPLYLRLQSPTTDLLYGDYDPNIDAGVVNYGRRLTGARALFSDNGVTVLAFAASTSQSQIDDTFAANGTSGPFYLKNSDIVRYSETIEVITTDRNSPSLEIATQILRRGQDYDIDYSNGRIFFAKPISSRDAEGNPNSILVSYEIEADKEDGLIIGGRASYTPEESTTYSVTAVGEQNIQNSAANGMIFGVDLKRELSQGVTGHLSVAQTRQTGLVGSASNRNGYAAEASIEMDTDKVDLTAFAKVEDEHFGVDNIAQAGDRIISAGMSADVLLSAHEKISDDETAVVIESHLEAGISAEKNLDTGHRELTSEAMFVRHTDSVENGIGLKIVDENSTDDLASAGQALKITGRSAFSSTDGKIELSLSQEVTLASKGTLDDADVGLLEATWRATDNLSLTFSNEHAVTDNGISNIFSLGAEVEAWEGATLRAGGLSASQGDTVDILGYGGIEQKIKLSQETSFTVGFEGQDNISSLSSQNSPTLDAGLSHPRLSEAYTVVSAHLEHNSETWTGKIGVEDRQGEEVDSRLLSMSADRVFTDELSVGTEGRIYTEKSAMGGRQSEHELKASIAYRPLDARFAVLDQITARYESNDTSSVFTAVNSVYYSRRLQNGHEVNLRHGIKYTDASFGKDEASDLLNLIGAEYRHEINEWFDLGVHNAIMHSMQSNSLSHSYGASVGITPFDNAWVSLGYNADGFKDADFSENGYTDKGAFLQFRMKFDSQSIKGLLRD